MTLEALLAEREIEHQLVRLARAMDERSWEVIEEIAVEDLRADLGTGPLEGRAAFVAQMRRFLDECGPTQHLLGNVLVEVSGDTATSRAYVSDWHLGRGDRADLHFRTLGDYHDRWQRRDGVWRLLQRTKRNRGQLGSLEVFGKAWRSGA